MSEVRITTKKPLTKRQMEKIEKRFGFELIIDEELPDYDNYVYYFGYDRQTTDRHRSVTCKSCRALRCNNGQPSSSYSAPGPLPRSSP